MLQPAIVKLINNILPTHSARAQLTILAYIYTSILNYIFNICIYSIYFSIYCVVCIWHIRINKHIKRKQQHDAKQNNKTNEKNCYNYRVSSHKLCSIILKHVQTTLCVSLSHSLSLFYTMCI